MLLYLANTNLEETMEKFSNIKEFLKQYEYDLEISKEIELLVSFTYDTKETRDSDNRIYSIITNNKDRSYTFHYEEKEYRFHVFSDFDLQACDKQSLKKEERVEKSFFRTLKLACSMDILEPKVVLAHSSYTSPFSFILFKINGIEKVISYQHNLVMNKEDYYHLFQCQEINVVDKFDLYQIYYMITSLNDMQHIFEYLTFTKEIWKELSKKEIMKYFHKKYDVIGKNCHNAIVLGGHHFDHLFFDTCDIYKMRYAEIIKELKAFTENPKKLPKHITYNQEKGCYKLEEKHFGVFNFHLLSDLIMDEEIQKNLLSKDRYHYCHGNAHVIAKFIHPNDHDHVWIVAGKCKENENDFFYHSWVEDDKENIVFDYNNNIVMNRDKYYQLFEAEAISKTSIVEMQEIVNTLIDTADFVFYYMDLNYFGKELLEDFKRNEKIFVK